MTSVTKVHLAFAAMLFLATGTQAAPPDLTNGGVPNETPALTINLGPTGLRGWVYHVKTNTGESRQILVKSVAAGSPADGIVAVNDVILGADGTGAIPANFTSDARKALADAINAAEARTPATLKLKVWRADVTSTVDLTLQTLGSYSATAPYNCPKSALILKRGLQYIMTQAVPGGAYMETAGRYSFGTLSLLAANNPSDPDNAARMARAQTEARALVPTAAEMTQMMSNVRDTASTWQRGHTLIVLAEYYLRTGDVQVLPAIEAYAVNIAKNQSLFGTLGHIFAEKNPDGSDNGPMGGVYGPVNSTGLPCFYGLLLAKECGLSNPEIAPAIERTSRFFAYYTGKGALPYGEHEAYYQMHESNGKCGLAALAFELQDNRAEEQDFFAKMATAATSERENGHTGAFFNYLWSPLGAAAGGEEAAAAHFSRIRWMLDLNRRWDGGFDYDCLNGEGPNSGSTYNDFRMSTAALLLYALPLRQLHLTGRGHDPAGWLGTADVSAAAFSDTYNAPARSTSQLVTDLGDWSPKIQRLAADELAKRTSETTALLPALHALAIDPAGSSRVGACFALGKINNSSSAPVLAALLTDPVNHVRFAAAEGMRYMSQTLKLGQLNTILAAAASTATPLLPFNEEDPLHFSHARLAMLLFYGGNAYGPKGVIWNTVTGVDRNYLYPAIRAVAASPIGQARSTLYHTYRNLTPADVEALADTLVDSIHYRAPADKMFSEGIRKGGLETLQARGIAEGVPLSMVFDQSDGRTSVTSNILAVLELYAGASTTVVPDPDVTGYLKDLLGGANAADAQAVLDAIAADTNPLPLTPFKSIQAVTADAPSLTLPAKLTVLRVNSTDLAKGDSVYTWRKVHGAGNVSFFPNGTADSKNTTILFDGIPGQYLFEVKMSDSRGFTEVYQTVPVTLYNSGGGLPANDPPTANPQSVTAGRATTTPVTLSATDPEGYPLDYVVTSLPAHGTLTGTAPYLLYTSAFSYTGPDGFTFKVTDSEGQVSSATIDITVDPVSGFGLAVYEPFDYPAGGLAGKSGSTEVGFSAAWTASASAQVAAGSLGYGSLATAGNSIGNLNGGSNNFGGARAIGAAALAGNGLLADGATLWFGVEVGYGTGGNLTNSRLAIALANSQFSSGNYDYWIANEGAQLGSGIGLTLGRFNGNGKVVATQFRELAAGDGFAGNLFGTEPPAALYAVGGQSGLIVGKITWGAASDTIELYRPDTDLILPANPISTLTVNVNQSTFDTLTWCRGDVVVMDEIRFGSTYDSVLLGTVAMTADLTPPLPGSMSFASAPAPAGASSITMVAATAYDPLGVEYYFTCTAGGGNDSGWQSGTSYTDFGLTPGVPYSYTVTARDKSPANNTTSPSAAASATIATQVTVPDVVGISQAIATDIINSASLTVGNVTHVINASVPPGDVISQSPNGETIAAIGATVDLVVSLDPDTTLPAIASTDMVDDNGGASIPAGTLVTYTLTFNKDMDAATVNTADFSNAGSSAIAVGTINEASPGVFSVQVTPITAGTLQLQIAAGAVIKDPAGNTLDTTAAIADDTVITVSPAVTTVPNVVGQAQAAAQAAIVAANLLVGVVTSQYDEVVPAGNVISQSPTGGTGVIQGSSVNLVVSLGPTSVSNHANADIPVSGTVSGSYTNTQTSNNIYQAIAEVESGGNPNNRYSYLEHKWSFDVAAGTTVTFNVEAHHTANTEGDDFIFAYSTTGVNGTYQNMVRVTKTSDDNSSQSFPLPSGTSGTVHVRVIDANRSAGNKVLDTIFIDRMVFRTLIEDLSDTTPPTLAGSDIIDDQAGGPVTVGNLVTYTVTFSEDMDATTVDVGDFTNDAGGSEVSIGTITETAPGVFTVQVTPMTSGTLQLAVAAGAVLKDVAGNALNTTVAITDNTILTVNPVMVNAPNVVGLAQTPAEAQIAAANLIVGAVSDQYDATVASGNVISQNPGAGAVVPSGSAVDLVVSLGPEPDTTAPSISPADITDDQSGAAVGISAVVTYTLTFSEDMDAATVDAGALSNAGSAAVTIGSIMETSPGVYAVEATPTTAGTLQLQINAGALVKDVAGNDLDTTSAIVDDTILPVMSHFEAWSGGAAFGADANGDGVANGLAWVLGAPNAAADATGFLPTCDNTSDVDYFIFTYNRSDAANADANTTVSVQYGSDLAGWSTAEDDGDNVIISATDGGPTDSVRVKLKRSTLEAGSKLFARLNVVVTPP